MGIGNSSNRNGKISTESNFTYIEWKIRDFFSLPCEVDDCVCSPSFQMQDAKWRLCLYPNGEKDLQTTGYMDLLLDKEDSATSLHRVSYRFGIYKRDRQVYRSWRGEEDFFTNDKGWGVYFMLKKSVLHYQRTDLVPKGVVTFFCYLQVKSPLSAAKQTRPPIGVERLIIDFKNLLSSGEDSDVTIVVKDREFKAHTAFLRARSPVFSRMLFHDDMQEKKSGLVHIIDCEPEAFQHFLTYVYSGYPGQISSDIASGLYTIADKYDVEEIKTNCINFMIDSLSVETFCDVVSLSLLHDDSVLLDAAIQFFAKNTKEIIRTSQWQSLLKDFPITANELYLKVLNSHAEHK